jgi:hypothetical protein
VRSGKNLFTRAITWEELQNKDLSCVKLKTYKDCVREAIKYIGVRRTDRLSIANLAIRSCVIKHGGDMRSAFKNSERVKLTLKKFSKDIGVNCKTLNEWVRIRRFIDTLPKSVPVDFTTADLIVRRRKMLNLQSDNLTEYYLKFLNDFSSRSFFNVFRCVKAAGSTLKKHGTSNWNVEQVNKLNQSMSDLTDIWEGYYKVSNKFNLIMTSKNKRKAMH